VFGGVPQFGVLFACNGAVLELGRCNIVLIWNIDKFDDEANGSVGISGAHIEVAAP
jgi:hypothetical protein